MAGKNFVVSLSLSLIALASSSWATLYSKEEVGLVHQDEAAITRDVKTSLCLLRMLPDRWEFELNAQNTGSQSVFIMTEPVRSNGSKGSYLTLNQSDPSILEIGIQLYPSPSYSLYSNQTHVRLKRLEPGGQYIEQLIVPFPSQETSPPYKGLEHEMIDKSKVRSARAAIGILPDEEGIQDILRRKEGIGVYAGGLEIIERGSFKGKQLYEVQAIIRTPAIKL